MTTEQPLALRLADELMDGMSDEHWSQLKADAAAELRRLHAVNRELVEALDYIPQSGSMLGAQAEAKRLQALAKAGEQT